MDAKEPTVFIVDDDAALRDALQSLLRFMGLKAEAFPSADAFLQAYMPGRPGCLLLDVRMPGMSGLELQKHLAERDNPLPVILLTGHGDVAMAVEAMRVGAFDFVEKPVKDQVLLDRVHACLRQATEQERRTGNRVRLRECLDTLTPREREVAAGVAQGKASKVIAADLGISPRTVDVHRSRIMDKLGVRSSAELVRVLLSDEAREGDPEN